jgi:phage terminase small subunit
MARKRDPNRDKAYEIWKQHDGKITNREIAHLLSTDEKKIAVWKQRDKWNVVQQSKNNVVQQKEKPAKKARSPNKKNKEEPVSESDELTDKQRLFCLYYVKYFNATKAYQKAHECDYLSAKAHGYKVLQNVAVKREINRLKKEIADGILLDASAVLQKYIDIAFADITDFIEFGREEVTDDLGNPFEVNRVKFKESSEVDGTIVTEVKQGKDGVSVKLADKMRALEMLSKYFDLLSDNDKKRLQEEKMKVEISKAKAELEHMKNPENDDNEQWIASLKAVANKRRQLKGESNE